MVRARSPKNRPSPHAELLYAPRSPPLASCATQSLSIISHHKARLKLSGRLQLDEPVEYAVHASGALDFSLTERTQRLLRRFRTSMCSAGYDGVRDSAWVVVWPPLPLSIKIRLQREVEAATMGASVANLQAPETC